MEHFFIVLVATKTKVEAILITGTYTVFLGIREFGQLYVDTPPGYTGPNRAGVSSTYSPVARSFLINGCANLINVMRKREKPCHEPVDHSRQLPRLRRIEGQARGLQQMIEEQRPCLDVINQIGAVTAALKRVQTDMLREHLAAISRTSICGKLSDKELRFLADEVSAVFKRLG